jgi:RNA polymerase sigma-70 factor (ECF subfamily)
MPTSSSEAADTVADAELVQRLGATGDPRALEALFRRHATDLLKLAAGLVPHSADAEDIVQDVFVGLRLALRNYDERGTFRAWIRGVTVRTALAARRRTTRRQETVLDAAGDARAHSDTDAVAVRDALSRLPESLRDVVVLKLIEGYSHAEIAALLDIRAGTSEVRLFRAIRRLRELLSENA